MPGFLGSMAKGGTATQLLHSFFYLIIQIDFFASLMDVNFEIPF